MLGTLSHNAAGTTHDTTFSLQYNPAGQVTSRSRADSVFDPIVPTGINESYAANGLNQYTNAAGTGLTPAYGDGLGNLTSDGIRNYEYDLDNLLIKSGNVTLGYDPVGRLHQIGTSTMTTRFVYDGSALIAEFNGSTLLQRHVHGGGIDEPLVTYVPGSGGTMTHRWPIADERGSIIGLAGDSGTVTKVNKYDPYGYPATTGTPPASTNEGRFQYTGQVWLAELGLYYYKARMYHPRLGRFMQTDPIGYEGGMNLYAYAGGDPANSTDPSGLFPMCTTVSMSVAAANTYTYDMVNGELITTIHPNREYITREICTDFDFTMPTIAPPSSGPAIASDAGSAPPQGPQQALNSAASTCNQNAPPEFMKDLNVHTALDIAWRESNPRAVQSARIDKDGARRLDCPERNHRRFRSYQSAPRYKRHDGQRGSDGCTTVLHRSCCGVVPHASKDSRRGLSVCARPW